VHSCDSKLAVCPPNRRSSTGFAFKPPLTMRMLPRSASAGKSAIVIKSLHLVRPANIAGAISFWRHALADDRRGIETGSSADV
jgi:hypothetical protein